MKLHGSAALSQRQRRRLVVLVGSGMTITAAAVIVGCSRQTGSKWVNRDRRGERCGREERSSSPSPRRWRLTHFEPVWREQPTIAAAAAIVIPEPTSPTSRRR